MTPAQPERGFEERADEPRPIEARAPEIREPRPARDRAAETQPVVPAMDTLAAARGEPAPTRAEGNPPRRRERFGNDQPDFLRRPVRRPRREAEPAASVEPQASAPEEPKLE